MTKYRYRPVLFFLLAYLFTWVFWVPAIFLPENAGSILMVIGLIAPAVVLTLFILLSGSKQLKQDLKNKLVGFYKVKWGERPACRRRICGGRRGDDPAVARVRAVDQPVLVYGGIFVHRRGHRRRAVYHPACEQKTVL